MTLKRKITGTSNDIETALSRAFSQKVIEDSALDALARMRDLKRWIALGEWAKEQMGDKYERFVTEAEARYQISFCRHLARDRDVFSAASKAQYAFPRKVRKKDSRFEPDTTLHNLLLEYTEAHTKTKGVKAKRNGIPGEIPPTPSARAHEIIAKKHRLQSASPDALRKHLDAQRDLEKRVGKFVQKAISRITNP